MTYPGKGKADYWAPGDHNAVCFECGRKFKASTMVRHWQGYYLCKQHWNPRQPQDFVRAIPDVQTPPWVQPMPADVFAMDDTIMTEYEITIYTQNDEGLNA